MHKRECMRGLKYLATLSLLYWPLITHLLSLFSLQISKKHSIALLNIILAIMNECMAWLKAVQFLICCTYICRPQKLPLLLLGMIIGIIITNNVNVITGRLLYTSNHIYQKIVNAIQSVVCKDRQDELVFLYIYRV